MYFLFIIDILYKMNTLNIILQGKNKHACNMFSDIKGFLLNIKNIKEKISKNDLSSLPLLVNENITNFNCKFYFQKVYELLNEFEKRFLDFKSLKNNLRYYQIHFRKYKIHQEK